MPDPAARDPHTPRLRCDHGQSLVHRCRTGQYGRPAESADRRNQTGHHADARYQSLRHGHDFKRTCRSSVCSPPTKLPASISETMADQGVHSSEPSRPPAPHRHHQRRYDLVCGLRQRPSRPPQSGHRRNEGMARPRADRNRSPTGSSPSRTSSGTAKPADRCRTLWCVSIPRPRNFSPGPFPPAEESFAT